MEEFTINKQRILKTLESLPDDVTIEDAHYRLDVLEQISKSVANSGKKISQEEIETRFLNE